MSPLFRLRVALADVLATRVLVPVLGVVGCLLDLWRGRGPTVADLWPDEEAPPVAGETEPADGDPRYHGTDAHGCMPCARCRGFRAPNMPCAWCDGEALREAERRRATPLRSDTLYCARCLVAVAVFCDLCGPCEEDETRDHGARHWRRSADVVRADYLEALAERMAGVLAARLAIPICGGCDRRHDGACAPDAAHDEEERR